MSILSLRPNAEQIVFEVSSEKNTLQLTGLDESIAEYGNNLAPDAKYMTQFTIKVFAVDGDGVNVMDIGFLEGIYFEAEELMMDELSFTMLCDMVSQDVYKMAEAITDKRGIVDPFICPPEENIVYVRKLYVEEECRGLGVGQYIINNLRALLTHSLNLDYYICILAPYPQTKTGNDTAETETDGINEKIASLIRFYEKAGFSRMQGSEYMYRKRNDLVDQFFDSFLDD